MDRTLSLDESDIRRNRELLWNRDQHVHMARLQVPFLNPALLLLGEATHHIAQILPNLPNMAC